MQERKVRTVRELLAKGRLALENPYLLEIAREADSPRGAADWAEGDDLEEDQAQACRWLNMIQRDHGGRQAFDRVVVARLGILDLTTAQGVKMLGVFKGDQKHSPSPVQTKMWEAWKEDAKPDCAAHHNFLFSVQEGDQEDNPSLFDFQNEAAEYIIAHAVSAQELADFIAVWSSLPDLSPDEWVDGYLQEAWDRIKAMGPSVDLLVQFVVDRNAQDEAWELLRDMELGLGEREHVLRVLVERLNPRYDAEVLGEVRTMLATLNDLADADDPQADT